MACQFVVLLDYVVARCLSGQAVFAAMEDLTNRNIRKHSFQDEDVHSHRGRYQRDFRDHDHDDPEPDKVKTLSHDNGSEERNEDQDDRHRVHHATKHQKDAHDGKDQSRAFKAGRLDEVENTGCKARKCEQFDSINAPNSTV